MPCAAPSQKIEQYRNRITIVDSYLRRNHISRRLRRLVREHYRNALDDSDMTDEQLLLQMPTTLSREVMREKNVRVLRRTPILVGSDKAIIKQLATLVRQVTFLAEEIICTQGDICHELYILDTGNVKLTAKPEKEGEDEEEEQEQADEQGEEEAEHKDSAWKALRRSSSIIGVGAYAMRRRSMDGGEPSMEGIKEPAVDDGTCSPCRSPRAQRPEAAPPPVEPQTSPLTSASPTAILQGERKPSSRPPDTGDAVPAPRGHSPPHVDAVVPIERSISPTTDLASLGSLKNVPPRAGSGKHSRPQPDDDVHSVGDKSDRSGHSGHSGISGFDDGGSHASGLDRGGEQRDLGAEGSTVHSINIIQHLSTPGTALCDLAFFFGVRQRSTLEAMRKTTCLSLSHDAFKALASEFPNEAHRLRKRSLEQAKQMMSENSSVAAMELDKLVSNK